MTGSDFYIGVGVGLNLNLNGMLFCQGRSRCFRGHCDTLPAWAGRKALEHAQVLDVSVYPEAGTSTWHP